MFQMHIFDAVSINIQYLAGWWTMDYIHLTAAVTNALHTDTDEEIKYESMIDEN